MAYGEIEVEQKTMPLDKVVHILADVLGVDLIKAIQKVQSQRRFNRNLRQGLMDGNPVPKGVGCRDCEKWLPMLENALGEVKLGDIYFPEDITKE